jgi:hypothetical protein
MGLEEVGTLAVPADALNGHAPCTATAESTKRAVACKTRTILTNLG